MRAEDRAALVRATPRVHGEALGPEGMIDPECAGETADRPRGARERGAARAKPVSAGAPYARAENDTRSGQVFRLGVCVAGSPSQPAREAAGMVGEPRGTISGGRRRVGRGVGNRRRGIHRSQEPAETPVTAARPRRNAGIVMSPVPRFPFQIRACGRCRPRERTTLSRCKVSCAARLSREIGRHRRFGEARCGATSGFPRLKFGNSERSAPTLKCE